MTEFARRSLQGALVAALPQLLAHLGAHQIEEEDQIEQALDERGVLCWLAKIQRS